MQKNKVSKVSIVKIKDIIKSQVKEVAVIPYSIGDQMIEVVVTPSINKEDKIRFINEVLDGCFDLNTYQPYYKDELFNIAILTYYTNLKTDTNVDTLFDLVVNTDIISLVKEVINSDQLYGIKSTIDDLIGHRKQEILSNQKEQLNQAIRTLEQYVDQLISIGENFKDIDPNEMMSLFTKIAQKDDQSLSKAVLDIANNKSNRNNVVNLIE